MLVNSKICLQVWVKTLFFLREPCPESPFKINPFHSSILKIIGVGSYLEQTRAAGRQTTSSLVTDCEAEWEKFWCMWWWQSSAHVCRDPARFQSHQQVAIVPALEMEADSLSGQEALQEEAGTSETGITVSQERWMVWVPDPTSYLCGRPLNFLAVPDTDP